LLKAIFEDISQTIRHALVKIREHGSAENLISKTALEQAINELL